MTLNNFKATMIAKAKKQGLTENFGQKELDKLKEKYKYNPYGTVKERETAQKLDGLFEWLINFEG